MVLNSVNREFHKLVNRRRIYTVKKADVDCFVHVSLS